MMASRMVAGFVVYPRSLSETNGQLLIESIRAFGGVLSEITLWCLVPRIKTNLSRPFLDLLDATNVRLELFDIDSSAIRFPLAADVVAAAHAEARVQKDFDLFVWLGANTIVFHEPQHFVIPDGKQVGYRPVHHINIGSPADQPLNEFWTCVYEACRVPAGRVFSMETHVDGKIIRPYFNATALVVRPECKLFAAWHEVFHRSYQKPEFLKIYKQNEQYAVFMHQAILSGIVLAMFQRNDLYQLPSAYNYPLHLWDQDVRDSRPRRLTDLVTARHEGFYRDPDWRKKNAGRRGL